MPRPKRKGCHNCATKHSIFNDAGLWAHWGCRDSASVGEATDCVGERCVCANVEKRNRARGCPGWKERE